MDQRSAVFAAILIAINHTPARADEVKNKQEREVEITSSNMKGGEPVIPSELSQFCFFAGGPPPDEKYTEIKRFRVGKRTYGGVKDILPRLAFLAQKAGADAVINYSGSQRFGVLPWRVVRPVVGGMAIKWTTPKNRDCEAMGGATLETIVSDNEPPRHRKSGQTAAPAPTPSTSPTSAADRLTTLEDLRDRKLISPAEYEERRRKILEGL